MNLRLPRLPQVGRGLLATGVIGGGQYFWETKAKATQTASLVALWPQRDLSGAVLTDISGNGFNGGYHNVVLGQPGIGDSGKSAKYDGSTSYTSIYSPALNALFNKNEFTIIQWIRARDATVWSTSAYMYAIRLAADASNNDISLYCNNPAGYIRWSYSAGGTNVHYDKTGVNTLGWICLAMTISISNNRMRAYYCGSQQGSDLTGLGTWSGSLSNTYSAIGSRYGTGASLGFPGWYGPGALWNKELTAPEVANLANPFDVRGILFIGDSKTNGDLWEPSLETSLSSFTGTQWVETPTRIGISGIDTSDMKDRCDADIVAMKAMAGYQAPQIISINLGANDAGHGTMGDGSTWKANTLYIANAYHVAFPGAALYLTKIWKRACAADITIMDSMIDQLVASYSWIRIGCDEGTFLPGSDDGATYTTDGTHPNAAGGLLEAAALLIGLGY